MTHTSAREKLAAALHRNERDAWASSPNGYEIRMVLGRAVRDTGSGSSFWPIAGGILALQHGQLYWSPQGDFSEPALSIGYCGGAENVGECLSLNWRPNDRRLSRLFRVVAIRADVASREGFEVFA